LVGTGSDVQYHWHVYDKRDMCFIYVRTVLYQTEYLITRQYISKRY
jgi:hypothetical protein